LEIIRQGSANAVQAQSDINKFTDKLNSTLAEQQALAVDISAKQGKISGIQSAISGAQGSLGGLSNNLTNINNQIGIAKGQQQNLTSALNSAIGVEKGLEKQVENANDTVNNIRNQLNAQQNTCAKSNAIIAGLNGNITDLQNTLVSLDGKISAIDGTIKGYNHQINELLAQIQALKNQILIASAAKQDLLNLNSSIPQKINNLQGQIAAAQAQCSGATSFGPNDLNNALNNLANLQSQLANADATVDNLKSSLASNGNTLNGLNNQASTVSGLISQTNANLNALKNQLPVEQDLLNKLYAQGNNLINTINNLNSSLHAANARLQSENDALGVANLNLQSARSKQQEVNNQINLVLQANTAGLPFPSAPTVNGLLTTLSTANNIDSITSFLIRAYGNQLTYGSLAKYSNTKVLYTFGPSVTCGNVGVSAIVGSSSGSSTPNVLCGQGKISQVISPNQVVVNTSIGAQTITLADCALSLSNAPNYSFNSGDLLLWKGHYDSSKQSWNAHQVTCLN
jgi:chromosome segregation ATPase